MCYNFCFLLYYIWTLFDSDRLKKCLWRLYLLDLDFEADVKNLMAAKTKNRDMFNLIVQILTTDRPRGIWRVKI